MPQLDFGHEGMGYRFLVTLGVAMLGVSLRQRRPILASIAPACLLLLPVLDFGSEVGRAYAELLPQLAVGGCGFFLVRALERRYGQAVVTRSNPGQPTP